MAISRKSKNAPGVITSPYSVIALIYFGFIAQMSPEICGSVASGIQSSHTRSTLYRSRYRTSSAIAGCSACNRVFGPRAK